MGDTQKLPWQELLPLARERFEAADDLTLSVEEEFAILDPATLSLTNRFEDLQAAARGTELEEHLVGELIASEVEVRTGRCETFTEAAVRLRRAPRPALRPRRLARPDAGGHRHPPVVALAGAADHRHAALPPQRRDPPLRGLAQQQLRPARPRRHPRGRPRDRGQRRPPRLPAGAARALGQLPVPRAHLHLPALDADADLHAHVPPLRHPGRLRRLGRLRELRPPPLRDGLDRRAHPDLVERPPAPGASPRSRCGSATRSPTCPRQRRSRR